MAIQVKVPTVGESITEVTIANWLKKDGDVVQMDEVIAELESDKATFELTAPAAGVLRIKKQQGDAVPIGELICEIEESANAGSSKGKEESKPAAESKKEAPKSTGEVKEMKVPAVGESITEVTISTWLKKDGDFVKLDEVIAEVESDKATFELPAEANGILRTGLLDTPGVCGLVSQRVRTQQQLACAVEALDRGFAARSGGTVGAGFQVREHDRAAGSRVACAAARLAVVFGEAAGDVGGDAGVECTVGAAQDVDEPGCAGHSSAICCAHRSASMCAALISATSRSIDLASVSMLCWSSSSQAMASAR